MDFRFLEVTVQNDLHFFCDLCTTSIININNYINIRLRHCTKLLNVFESLKIIVES